MISELTGNNMNKTSIKSAVEDNIRKLVKTLEEQIEALNEKVDLLNEMLNTETANVDNLNVHNIDADFIASKQAEIKDLYSDIAKLSKVLLVTPTGEWAGVIETDNAHTMIELPPESSSISARDFYGKVSSAQEQMEINVLVNQVLSSNDIRSIKAKINNLETDLFNVKTLVTEDIGSNTLHSDYGTINELSSDKATISNVVAEDVSTDTLEASEVDSTIVKSNRVEATTVKSTSAISDTIKTPVITGTKQLNLDPLLATDDDYYVLKIKKGFSTFNVSVDESFDISLTSAYCRNADIAESGVVMALVHQKELNQVVALSDDKDFVYIQIAPNNVNELKFNYTAKNEIVEPVDIIPNGTFEYDYYYKPARVAECIMLGKVEDGSSNYRMTVLGEMKAAIKVNEGAEDFQDVIIANNLFVKDYYSDVEGKWIYTNGNSNDYLSRFTDRKEMVWRNPVDVDENGRLFLRNNHTEEVIDDTETHIGYRDVPGTFEGLLKAGALTKWTGKVYYTGDGSTPPVEGNPLIHLGEVTEGKWNAQDIVSNDSFTINHPVVTWEEVDYSATKDTDDLSWVRV